jgi:hypothetical protein
MNNVIKINFNDSVINELNEAVDIISSKKTVAYKYFNGCSLALENYLTNAKYNKELVNEYQEATQLELFS